MPAQGRISRHRTVQLATMQRTNRLSLRLFGEFALVANGAPPAEVRISSRKGRALIAYVAVHPDHRVSREHLADLLWGDRHDVQARQDLRQCLVSIRRALAAAAPELLVIDASHVGLRTADLAIDALELATLAAAVTPDFGRAAALHRGAFLSGMSFEESFGDWLSSTRLRFDAIAADIFERCARCADAGGNGKQATDAVERLIEFDPLREDWQRLVLELYARYRSREAALSHADRMIALLRRELGTDPEPATMALVQKIRRRAIAVAPLVSDCKVPERAGGEGEQPTAFDWDIVPSNSPSTAVADAAPFKSWLALASFVAQLSTRISRSRWWLVGVASSLIIALLVSSSTWLFLGGQVGEQSSAISEPFPYVRSPFRAGGAAHGPLSTAGATVPVMLLPFTADDDPDGRNQANANAITDDLTNVLTQNSELQVISRRAALAYTARPADFATMRARFGIRYVIDGAVRTQGARLLVNVALVDAINERQVWADQFVHDDGQAVHGEIVARLARELQFGVTLAQGTHDGENGTGETAVEQLIFKGRAALLRDSSRASTEEELALFEQALRREPNLPAAQLGLAMTLIRATLNSLADDPQQNLDRAEELLNKVLQRDPASYRAQYWKGLLHKARGELGGGHVQYQSALQALNRSLELNPSAAYVHAQVGAVLVKLGQPKDGLDEIQYAIRLNPKDPSAGLFYVFAAEAELEMHHDTEAIEWLTRAIACVPRNPTAYKLLSASYALMGDRANMERSSAEFRKFSASTAYQRFINGLTTDAVVRPAMSRSRISQGLRLAFAP
jgi:DNA-binding SARP family transcriptional activator/TolB-like protein